MSCCLFLTCSPVVPWWICLTVQTVPFSKFPYPACLLGVCLSAFKSSSLCFLNSLIMETEDRLWPMSSLLLWLTGLHALVLVSHVFFQQDIQRTHSNQLVTPFCCLTNLDLLTWRKSVCEREGRGHNTVPHFQNKHSPVSFFQLFLTSWKKRGKKVLFQRGRIKIMSDSYPLRHLRQLVAYTEGRSFTLVTGFTAIWRQPVSVLHSRPAD